MTSGRCDGSTTRIGRCRAIVQRLQSRNGVGGHLTQVAIKQLGFAREKGDLLEQRVEPPRVGEQTGVGTCAGMRTEMTMTMRMGMSMRMMRKMGRQNNSTETLLFHISSGKNLQKLDPSRVVLSLLL